MNLNGHRKIEDAIEEILTDDHRWDDYVIQKGGRWVHWRSEMEPIEEDLRMVRRMIQRDGSNRALVQERIRIKTAKYEVVIQLVEMKERDKAKGSK